MPYKYIFKDIQPYFNRVNIEGGFGNFNFFLGNPINLL